MAKVPATVRPSMVAESADGVIEGGDSSEIEIYIDLCAECERIAIQIHPSYEKQYKDVSAMMHIAYCFGGWGRNVWTGIHNIS